MDNQPWKKLDTESAKAYAAFCSYYLLPARDRSLDQAYSVSNRDRTSIKKRASGQWRAWSVAHDWVVRSLAYDEHLADQDRLLWEERRKASREKDWNQAEAMRKIVDDSLPHAERFIRTRRAIVPAQGDTPEREVITMTFNIVALSQVLMNASKLQLLATGRVTENLQPVLSEAQVAQLIEEGITSLAAERGWVKGEGGANGLLDNGNC